MRIWGEMNQLIHNLVIYSASLATYKGRKDRFDPHWPGAIETEMSRDAVLIDNAVGKGRRIAVMLVFLLKCHTEQIYKEYV